MLKPGDRKKGSETFQQELEALYRENQQLIYRAAYSVTGDNEDAEDVLQTVFLRLIERQEFPNDFSRNPKGYLHTAAVNEALHVKATRERQRLTDDDLDTLEIPAPEPRCYDDIQRVRAAIARMKPEFVAVLDLHYKEGHTCIEIARLQRRPLGSVLSDLFRARAELKRLMSIEEKNSEKQKDKHTTGRGPLLADGSQA